MVWVLKKRSCALAAQESGGEEEELSFSSDTLVQEISKLDLTALNMSTM